MYKKERDIYLIGIGMGTDTTLTKEGYDAIGEAQVLLGAQRMIAPYEKEGKLCVREYRPETVRQYLMEHENYKKCAVLLSGDTGFYSGAAKLAKELEDIGEIHFIPGISSVACLAAKIGISWEDAALVSLHGRKQNLIYSVVHNQKTFALLDRKSAKELCEKLKKYHLLDVTVYVGNRLSYPDERLVCKKGEDLLPEDFDELAAVMIINPNPDTRVCPHILDSEFIRGEGEKRVPMTKETIRAAVIAALELTEDAVLYDVGAGTGSVSVEAAGMAAGIRVYAIEKNPNGCSLIEKNKQKFRADQIEIIEGTAPEALEELEAPTHVFIGGSTGNLREILLLVQKKNKDVRIVITAVSMETVCEAMEAAREGLLKNPEISQVTAAKCRLLGSYHMMLGQNPVYIISAGGSAR